MTAIRLALLTFGLSPLFLLGLICTSLMTRGDPYSLVAVLPVYLASAILTYNAPRISGSRLGLAFCWLSTVSVLLIPPGYAIAARFVVGRSVRETQLHGLGMVILYLAPCLTWLFTTLALAAILAQKGRRDRALLLVPAIILQSIGIVAMIGGEAIDFLTEPRGGEAGMGRIILMGLLGLAAMLAQGAGLLVMSVVAFGLSRDPRLYAPDAKPTGSTELLP
jgi:hypothetical protein